MLPVILEDIPAEIIAATILGVCGIVSAIISSQKRPET